MDALPASGSAQRCNRRLVLPRREWQERLVREVLAQGHPIRILERPDTLRRVWEAEKPRQIWDVAEFRERQRGGAGVIVIFDRVRDAPIAHVPECQYVPERYFEQKMIEMGGKNGRYWWFERFADAERTLGARRCPHCG